MTVENKLLQLILMSNTCDWRERLEVLVARLPVLKLVTVVI